MTDSVKTLRESYHDYMSRKLKEVDIRLSIADRRDKEILELKERVTKLEQDISNFLGKHE